ncbi:KICSTOR complex protein SZT2-like isoform X4 [Ptychodera flava]|uniref:KICSTOR complex protein SZT2-like isoform X4 n=1 Tax=Ptychodera flava TaxID=63121 RepID=UPI00396A525E
MSSETKEEASETLDADEVYLLMKKEYRISRNIRSAWFFSYLNNIIQVKSEEDLIKSKEELEVLSVIPRKDGKSQPSSKSCKYRLIPTSHVTFLARCYRLVYILDLSPSMSCVDILSGQVSYDEVFSHFRNCLLGLIKPFTVPGSSLLLSPQIYVTVVAYTPLMSTHTQQVIVQGCLITKDNVNSLLEKVQSDLDQFETCLFEASMKSVGINPYLAEVDQLTGGVFDDIIDKQARSGPRPAMMSAPDNGLVDMLRYGILALQLLPDNTSAGIIVITDGITGLPDMAIADSLLSELRKNTIACSFIQVGRGYHPHCSFGNVPHVELMQGVATATFGAFLTKCPNLEDNMSTAMNLYHRAFFSWNFQKGLDGIKIDHIKGRQHEVISADKGWTSDSITPSFVLDKHGVCAIPMIRKKHSETNLHTAIANVLSLRLREGYTIKDVALTKSETQLEVKLALPWRHNVRIEYHASSPWPVSSGKRNTHVEVTIEGNYEFLHDVTCTMKQAFKSVYRTIMVRKFWQTLQSISQTDTMLVHLMSFAANPAFYTIPDSIKKGVPLFYLPPNSGTPVLVEYGSAKETGLSQFASYWKPIILMDINVWQKWLHTHRIGLILVHDMPLPKNLHSPNSSGRYHTISCRVALSELNSLLREWSTFVLMENHSYVKLLFSDKDGPPTSFYILRVTSKPPCMVLRFAFLGGTPGCERNQIVSAMKEKLLKLTFPQRASQQEQKQTPSAQSSKRQASVTPTPSKSNRPALQRSMSEKPCIVLLHKPVEKILIRYNRIPADFTTVHTQQQSDQSSSTQLATPSKGGNRAALTMFNTLSKYMYHQRWIWSTHSGSSMQISMQALTKLLHILTKVRLAEGFNFANCNSGIVSFLAEIEMKDLWKFNTTPTDLQVIQGNAGKEDVEASEKVPHDEEEYNCVVQYIMFPPHPTAKRESFSSDEVDLEPNTAEADGELEVVTECWIEPQSGLVFDSPEERSYMDGLGYKQVAQAVFPIDQEIISTMLTYEYLRLMCTHMIVGSPVSCNAQSSAGSIKDLDLELSACTEPTIHKLPFDFDVTKLLPKCQQVEMLFSTFSEDEPKTSEVPDNRDKEKKDETTDSDNANEILFTLLRDLLDDLHNREVTLSDRDCRQFAQLVLQRDRKNRKPVFEPPEDDEVENVEKPPQIDSKTSVNSTKGLLFSLPSQERAGEWSDSQQTTSSAKDASQRSEQLKAALGCDSKVPRWVCYVKSVDSSGRMQFTFMPASYGDLKKLMKKKDSKHVGKESKTDDKPGDGNLNKATEEGSEKSDPVKRVESKSEGTPASSPRENKLEVPDFETRHVRKTSGSDRSGEVLRPSFKRSKSIDPNRRTSQGTDYQSCISLTLPIYVYDCSYNSLTNQLSSKDSSVDWVPDDVFQDLRFYCDMDDCSNGDGEDKQKEGETSNQRERCLSGGSSRFHDRRQSSGLGSQNTQLTVHCNTLSDAFHRCFVSGLYKSLCTDQYVACNDVQLAVDKVCEESLIEIDITSFLESVCGHVTAFSEKVNMEEHAMETLQRTARLTSKAEQDSEDNKSVATSGEGDSTSDMEPAVLPQPSKKPVCRLPLSALNNARGSCEAEEGLHTFIKKKFNEIWGEYFKAVPSSEDIYYYIPPTKASDLSDEEGENDAGDDAVFNDAGLDSSTSDLNVRSRHPSDKESDTIHTVRSIPSDTQIEFLREDSIGRSVAELPSVDKSTPRSRDDVTSEMTSDSEFQDAYDSSNLESELGSSMESLAGSQDEDMLPLFVSLVCTVKESGNVGSFSVKSLPTCLSDPINTLESQASDIDLSDLSITLDIICLTLPPDLDKTCLRPTRRERTTSTGSMSSQPGTPPESDLMRLSIMSEAASLVDSAGGFVSDSMKVDPMSTLSSVQKEVVAKAKEQIKWLLEDEIASAKRLMSPINAATLEMVCNHVERSKDKRTCKAEVSPLQFVFGAEQSLGKFTEEYEKMKITGYSLKKEDAFYYLVRDKSLATAKALEQAVTAYSRENLLSHCSGLDQSQSSNDQRSPRVKKFEVGSDRGSVSDDECRTGEKETGEGGKLEGGNDQGERNVGERSDGMDLRRGSAQSAGSQGDDERRDAEDKEDWPDEEKVEVSLKQDGKQGDDNSSGSSIQVLSEEHGGESGQTQSQDQTQKEGDEVMEGSEEHQISGITESAISRHGSFIVLERTSGTDAQEHGDEDKKIIATVTAEIAEDAVVALGDQHKPDEDETEEEKRELKVEESVGDEQKDLPCDAKEAAADENTKTDVVTEGERSTDAESNQYMTAEGERSSEEEEAEADPTTGVEVPANIETKRESAVEQSNDSQARRDSTDPEQMQIGSPDVERSAKESLELNDNNEETEKSDRHIDSKVEDKGTVHQQHAKDEPSITVPVSEAVPIPASAIPAHVQQSVIVRETPPSEGAGPMSPSMTSTVSSDTGTPATEATGSDITAPLSAGSKHHRQASVFSTVSSGFTSVNASRVSLADEEEGYEGGASDSDMDGPMMSLTDIDRFKSLMPDFWLIMKIHEDKVDVNFHTRDVGDVDNLDTQEGLYNRVRDAIRSTCRTVNQMMLLNDLHDTRMCNVLLVAESDEDAWKQDEPGLPRVKSDLDEFTMDIYQQKQDYLAATMEFKPGHFACECVWTTHIAVHPRLKTGPGRMGTSRGIQSVKAVLNKFAVSNRKNMFVYKERSTGNVFYLRLYESMCATENMGGSSVPPSPRINDPSSTLVSAASSLMSLPIGKQGQLESEDDQQSIGSISRRPSDRDSGVDTLSLMSRSTTFSRQTVGESVKIDVHGITEASVEISEELIQVLKNRLDEATLDVITLQLARNPLWKLTATDVKFIQPLDDPPSTKVHFTVPQYWSAQLFAIGFYLRQNLLQFLHHPKYVDNKAENHFQDYSVTDKNYTNFEIPEKDVFLYITPQSSGGKGIAAISVSMVDGKGHPVSILSCPRPTVDLQSNTLATLDFDGFTTVSKYTLKVDQDAKYPGPTSLIQLCMWERGNVDIQQLTDKLMLAVRHSLCDVIMEYRVLSAPFGFWPYPESSSVATSVATSPSQTPPNVTPPKNTEESKSAAQSPSLTKQLSDGASQDAKSANGNGTTSPVSITAKRHGSSLADVFASIQEKPYFFRQQRSPQVQTLCDDVFSSSSPPSYTAYRRSYIQHSHEKRSKSTSYDTFSPPFLRKLMQPMQRSCSVAAPDHNSMQGMLDPQTAKSRRQLLFESSSAQASPKVSPSSRSMSPLTLLSKSPKGKGGDEISTQESERIHRHGERMKRRKELEEGDRGILHPMYTISCKNWLEHEFKLGVPAVHRFKADLSSGFSVDIALYELLTIIIPSICPDLVIKSFQQSEDLHYRLTEFPMPASHEERSEATSSDPSNVLQSTQIPYTPKNFIIVGRNMEQWRATVEMENAGYSPNYPSLVNPKTRKSFQQYDPLEPGLASSDKASDYVSNVSLGAGTLPIQIIVPRQRLFLLTAQKKQIAIYTYNWSSELNNMLDKLSNRLFLWHNARSHLLQCIVNQKMGLFHHRNFGDLENNSGKELNPFCRSTDDIDMLIKRTVPPLRDHTGLGHSRTMRAPSHHVHPGVPVFDELMRDTVPAKPLWYTQGVHRDPVIGHGTQLLDVNSRHKREAETRLKLENLYVTWQQRGGHANMPISEDTIKLLKMSSRLVHYCATPLLFSPAWRSKVLIADQDKSSHVFTASTSTQKPFANEEAWHNELRVTFVEQYIQYLQQLGFSPANTRPPSPKTSRSSPRLPRHQMRGAPRGGPSSHSERKPAPEMSKLERLSQSSASLQGPSKYLHKAVPGGIMLMELSFQYCYFIVKLYALEASRLPAGRAVNPQASAYSDRPGQPSKLSVLFTHECDKFKDLVHVHSFTYDFHLRCIQAYLGNRHLIFKQGYDVISCLSDFIRHYNPGPNFSRNHIYEGSFTFPSKHNPAHQLYDYMLQHAGMYGMRAIRMVKASHENDNSEIRDHEYMMVNTFARSGVFEDKDGFKHYDEFEIGIIIFHDTTNCKELETRPKSEKELVAKVTTSSVDKSASENKRHLLKLKYYVILTSRKDLFPKLTLTKQLGKLRSSDVPPRETTHGHIQMLLQVKISAEKIGVIVKQIDMHCRRDMLWQRLFVWETNEDESKESKKKKKKAAAEGEHEDKLTRMSFAEFNELLRSAHSVPLTSVDSQLAPLLTMPDSWYEKLMKVLQTKFSETSRLFTTPDSPVKYLAILNAHFLDMMILLSVDNQSKKADICAVYREPMKEPDRPDKLMMAVYDHVQSVINAACYHMWASMV